MRIFLAGIMQGSHLALTLHNQQYRGRLKELLAQHLPQAHVYDPLADHANSLEYDDERAKGVFLHHNRLCAEVDAVVAYVPQASMGTAIEMWEAFRHGRMVIAISPLTHNWAVRYLSHEIYADLEQFSAALATGGLAQRMTVAAASRRCSLDSSAQPATESTR